MATPRPNGLAAKEKGKTSPLPSFVDSKPRPTSLRPGADREPWTMSIFLPIPFVVGRRLRLIVPIPPWIYQASVARFGRKRGTAILGLTSVFILWTLLNIIYRLGSHSRHWTPGFMSTPPTLVFGRSELRRVWEWEIAAGHYPSTRLIPEMIALSKAPQNPGLPQGMAGYDYLVSAQSLPGGSIAHEPTGVQSTVGTGPRRVYLDITRKKPHTAYPPRPVPGSVADMDIVMDHCDFGKDKHVRDCLEVMRVGGGLDAEQRVRRGNTDDWKYIYVEQPNESQENALQRRKAPAKVVEDNKGLEQNFHRTGVLEAPLNLTSPRPARPAFELASPCDPDHPRLFHMFWAGPFTDKPYMALLSFLYTQNLGLHLPPNAPPSNICRPQFWVWINPGPAAAVPNPRARSDMMQQLSNNPWASPFLHARFKDVIKFQLWNTTEQLDGVPEIRNEWRQYKDSLFNSGGHIMKVPKVAAGKNSSAAVSSSSHRDHDSRREDLSDDSEASPSPTDKDEGGSSDDVYERTGSKSETSYDRMSVILSDMARFVLCHRFGGTYLDADTLLMRDWEELWGWRGAFAYRWSRLEKYNTAVLRMNKGSALGSFLFRTALRNGLDFHPMTVSRYTKEAYLENLLLRLPDALFDSAWLNTESFQRDRPPFPYFDSFKDFFETPRWNNAAPQMVGFQGFFRGAYAYHWHNFWWLAFDPARNWPDLGERFMAGELKQRAVLLEAKRIEAEKQAAALASSSRPGAGRALASPAVPAGSLPVPKEDDPNDIASDQVDLDWSTVIKRTFESFIRGDSPNMYGEWLDWA